ncbi:hypothetical protein FACS189459_1830 [Bacilli bacterium]|nr:hypothetical protein FACS189459_1830 [Bacilli bacterium]
MRASFSFPYAIDNSIPKRDYENNARLGSSIYGLYNFDAIKLISTVVQITKTKKGDIVGYSGTYKIDKDNEYIANVAIG